MHTNLMEVVKGLTIWGEELCFLVQYDFIRLQK